MGEPDALAVEDVEDGVPAGGEVFVPGVDELLARRREHGDVLPDRRPGEADDDVHAELARRACRHLHLFGCSPADTLGVAVAPDPVGQDPAVALVDGVVADRLPLEVVADGEDLEVVLLQRLPLRRDVRVVLDRSPRVEVVAPASDLESVVAPARGEATHLLERQVGPLAGEQGDRSGHGHIPFSVRRLMRGSPARSRSRSWSRRPRERAGPGGHRRTTGLGRYLRRCRGPGRRPGG